MPKLLMWLFPLLEVRPPPPRLIQWRAWWFSIKSHCTLSNVTFYKFGRHVFIKPMPPKRLADPPPWWWYLLCFCAVCCGLVWPLSCVVCKQVPKHNPKVRLWVLLCGQHRLAPYRLSCSATAVFLVYRVFATGPCWWIPSWNWVWTPSSDPVFLRQSFSVCGDPN